MIRMGVEKIMHEINHLEKSNLSSEELQYMSSVLNSKITEVAIYCLRGGPIYLGKSWLQTKRIDTVQEFMFFLKGWKKTPYRSGSFEDVDI